MKNKKNRINNLLKFGIFLFGISLLLWNCEKPNEEIPLQSESKFKISDKSFKEYLTNTKFIKAIEEIKPSKLQAKSSDDLYNFTIDSTSVREIQEGSQTTYTFFIKRENQDTSYFENLVVKVDSLNNTEVFLFKYEPKEGVEFFELHNSLNFNGEVHVTKLSTTNLNLFAKVFCYTVTTIYCSEHGRGDSGTYYNYTHIANSDCHNPDYFTTVSHEVCLNSSGGGGGFSTDDYTGGGGTDGSSNNNVNSSPITYPCGDSVHGCGKKADIISSRLGLNSAERNWFREQSEIYITTYENFLDDNGYSTESKNQVKSQIELETLSDPITLLPNQGKINNRDDQKYTHYATDGVRGYYKMEDGSKVVNSPTPLSLNSQGNLVSEFTSEISNDHYWYIKPVGTNEWANYLLKDSASTVDELELTFRLGVQDLALMLGRYVVPVEDFKIIFNGTDFDGQPTSRWLAAGLLVIDIVPGGKVLRAVKVIPSNKNVWKVIFKVGNKTYTRVVRSLTSDVLTLFNRYSPNSSNLITEALKKGEYLDDVIIEASETIADEASRLGRNLTWPEVKLLFKRGNDFNKKAVTNGWYPYNEIHLSNGKRLDSYDDILGEIVSRKATNLGNIQFSTFVSYLTEIRTKYAQGIRIRSNKYLHELDGELLQGTHILEIPDSNLSLPNIQYFIDYAWDNYQIRIRFKPE